SRARRGGGRRRAVGRRAAALLDGMDPRERGNPGHPLRSSDRSAAPGARGGLYRRHSGRRAGGPDRRLPGEPPLARSHRARLPRAPGGALRRPVSPAAPGLERGAAALRGARRAARAGGSPGALRAGRCTGGRISSRHGGNPMRVHAFLATASELPALLAKGTAPTTSVVLTGVDPVNLASLVEIGTGGSRRAE